MLSGLCQRGSAHSLLPVRGAQCSLTCKAFSLTCVENGSCCRPLPKSNSVFMWGSSAHEQKAARLAPRTRNVTRWPVTTCKLGKQTLCRQHLLWISHHLHACLPCMCRPLIGKSVLAALLYLLNGSDGQIWARVHCPIPTSLSAEICSVY